MNKDIMEVIPEDPEDIVREYHEVKKKINQLEKKRQLLRESLLKLFEEDETNEIHAGEVKVYRVSRERVQWDEKILKLILKPLGLWESVLSVDNNKIKDLLDKKVVDESLMKNARTTTQTWYTYTQKINPEKIPINSLSTSTSHSKTKHFPQAHESIKDKSYPQNKNEKIGEKIITITDLSRMKGDRVCIFGLDDKGTPIRPTLRFGIKKRHLLDGNNNLIVKPFARIKLNLLRHHPQYPHSEDYVINPHMKPELVRNLTPEESESFLNENLYSAVDKIFGAPIHDYRFLRNGEGKRSLGTIKADRILFFNYFLRDDGKDQYRIKFDDASGFTYDLPVTDCAFTNYCNNLKNIKECSIQSILRKLPDSLNKKRVYLRVGLTREFQNVHWLQVSGIHTFPDYKNG